MMGTWRGASAPCQGAPAVCLTWPSSGCYRAGSWPGGSTWLRTATPTEAPHCSGEPAAVLLLAWVQQTALHAQPMRLASMHCMSEMAKHWPYIDLQPSVDLGTVLPSDRDHVSAQGQALLVRGPCRRHAPCRCPRPGCGSCVALETQGAERGSRAAAACSKRAVNVQCSCGEQFCLCCGAKPHEPAPCAAVCHNTPAAWPHV